ncbi:MAG: PAS domain S-box protein [candidate division Zixibacteria bacterium]|nr:PAS domain S-box protein [candidate division Zixibacteria bacterium]
MIVMTAGKKSFKPRFTRIKPRFMLTIAVLLALIFLAIIIVSVHENQNNMLRMLKKEGSALMESVHISARNTIRATELVNDLVIDNLINVASIIDIEMARGRISSAELVNICQQMGINRIDIVDTAGLVTSSSFTSAEEKAYDTTFLNRLPLSQVIDGAVGVASFVLEGEGLTETDQLVAAVSRESEPGAVILFVNYQKLDTFNRQIGIGFMLRNIGVQPGIDYIFLQGREGVLLSSRKLMPVLAIDSDPFLQGLIDEDEEDYRLLDFEGNQVLEICRPFQARNFPPGILRIGLSLEGFHQIARNYRTQAIVLGVILFLLTFFLVTIAIANQNYRSVQAAYDQFKNITSNILGGIESAVVAVDRKENILLVNPKTEQIFSLSAGRVIGKNYREVFDNDDFLIDELNRTSQYSIVRETVYVDKFGQERTLLVAASRLGADKSSQAEGAVGIAYDITSRKKLESQAKRAERLSELGTLAAGVAHEIRNPLNAIAIASQRLKSEFEVKDDQDGYTKLAGTIGREIERLNRIIADFLALARSGRLEKESVNLKSYLAETVNLLRNEADDQEIDIDLECPDEIEVIIDLREFKKVIINLIKNSLEAIGTGGRVSIECSHRDDRIVIAVKDDGSGIDQEKLDKIFSPYFTTKPSGTGLGLAISHRIVTDHGGSLGVENLKGGGAMFVITLPASSK